MGRCRTLDRKHGVTGFAREGFLAATAMQLEPGDLLSPEPGDAVQALLQPPAPERDGSEAAATPPSDLRLALCAGAALGFQLAASKRLTLCYTRAGSAEWDWSAVLPWAQKGRLPLLLACTDVPGSARKRKGEVLSWAAVSNVASRCGLPVFPVDAEDAVAVYRVMYEAVLRARDGFGPAVLWGIFGNRSREETPLREQPLPRLQAYLRARGIKLKP